MAAMSEEDAVSRLSSQMESQSISDDTKPNLAILPTELLLDIVERLLPSTFTQKEEIQSAVRLSLVNRRMYELVQKRYNIYGSYDTNIGEPYLFLRTMITTPETAAKVYELASTYGVPEPPYSPARADKETIETAMRALDIPDCEKWVNDCNADVVNKLYLCAAIMMHTPNLASLTLDQGFSNIRLPPWLQVLKQSVCGSSFGRVHSFAHLKKLVVLRGPCLQLQDLLYLFRLPSLEKLDISHIVQTVMTRGIPWSILAQPTSIQELNIGNAYLSTEVVIELVKCCPALKRLSLQQSCNIQYLYNDDEFDESPLVVLNYAKLTGVLSRHCKSLEEIRIEEEMDHFQVAFQDRPAQTVVRTLVNLEGLRVMSLPLVALVDARESHQSGKLTATKLPRSLTELTINSVYMGQDDQVTSILQHLVARIRDDHLPDLSKVRMETTRFCNADMLDPLEERFAKEFNEVGVEFVMERAEFLSDADAESIEDEDVYAF